MSKKGLLYAVDVRKISYHLKNVFADKELEEELVIQCFRITADDGKTYDTGHYSLSAIRRLAGAGPAISDRSMI